MLLSRPDDKPNHPIQRCKQAELQVSKFRVPNMCAAMRKLGYV
jgi:hypothetical protein